MDKLIGVHIRDGKFSKGYPKAPGAGGKRLHVAIAEKALGHTLPPGAEIHHVDGIRTHNYNTNLVICEDHDYHALLAIRGRVVGAGGNPNTERICCHCQELVSISELGCGNQCRSCKSARAARRG